MSYEVLARKWRPQRFSELVGQEHISRTLKNAIARQRVAHAYLFVGSRGVGKTTSARLFAKSLNCTNLIDGEPCCECESCLSIATGNSLDVIEIDGASNNGVEDIRELRENVQYTPTSGNYKIYIIDEVHMLTTAAWNALLKTLEEPPPHVKFIFATTEAHKVLPTVVSRCQRFDFKSIPPVLIARKLREIADAENIFIDDAALAAIARAADGGMRDAQSIFDQMIAFCGGAVTEETITEQDVIDVFGMASTADIAGIVQAMFDDDVSGMLVTLHRLAGEGRDLERLFADLLVLLRNLMVVQYCSDSASILEIDELELKRLDVLGGYPQSMTRIFMDMLMAVEGRLRTALNKRVFLEVNLVRAMKEGHSVDINDVIAGFTNLKNSEIPRQRIVEKVVEVERVQAVADSAVALPKKKSEPASVAEASVDVSSEPAVVAADAGVTEAPVMVVDEVVAKVAPVTVETLVVEPLQPEVGVETTEPVRPEVEEEIPPSVAIEIQHAEYTQPVEMIEEPVFHEPTSETYSSIESSVESEPVYDEVVEYIQDEIEDIVPTGAAEVWHLVTDKISELHDGAILAKFLKEMKPVSFENGVFRADFTDDFQTSHRSLVTQPDSINKITNTLNLVTGIPNCSFTYGASEEQFVGENFQAGAEPSPVVKKRVMENELVQHVCSVFHGEVIDVRG